MTSPLDLDAKRLKAIYERCAAADRLSQKFLGETPDDDFRFILKRMERAETAVREARELLREARFSSPVREMQRKAWLSRTGDAE